MSKTQEQAQKLLGEAIRLNRKAKKLSQEDFADLVGVHRTYMGAIERGERNISLMNVLRIATALNIKPSELFAQAKL